MAWLGSVCDEELARKAAGSGLMAENIGVVSGNLTTVATAQAAVDAIVYGATRSICDRPIGQDCSRGFKVADNMDATFGSTFAAFYASLPDSADHQRQMIHG